MEQKEIKALLEKYWQAETTLEEERQLAAYFRQSGVSAELEPMRELFVWREEEALIGPGPDFDSRLLRRIGELDGATADAGGSRAAGGEERGLGRVVGGLGGRVISRFAFRFAAAAAIILCIGIGLLIPAISPGPGRPAAGVEQAAAEQAAARVARPVTDTYSDPNQAFAAVRHALLVASVGINEGKHITQKNITRLHDSWQAVTGD